MPLFDMSQNQRKLKLRGHRRSLSNGFSSKVRRSIFHGQVVLTALTLVWYSFFSKDLARATSTTTWGLTDETVTHTRLPAPYAALGLSTVQAAIRSVKDTYRGDWDLKGNYFVQALTMLTEIDPAARPGEWQVFVRNATYLDEVRCVYELDDRRSLRLPGSFRIPWMYDLPGEKSGAALLLHCPIPEQLERDLGIGRNQGKIPAVNRMRVRIFLDLAETEQPFQLLPFDLKPYHPPAEVEVGMCVAPIFGHWRAQDLIDWREHHRLLGVGPVHWYARSDRFADFFHNYPTAVESSDTYRFAPPIHPKTYNTSKLETDGMYADQILYALDCMLRSTYMAPSKWLAFFDLDEYFLPDPMPALTVDREKSIGSFLRTFHHTVPSVSLGRTHMPDNKHLFRSHEESVTTARAAQMDYIRSPHRDDWPGNHKHFHRVAGVEATSVHAPTALYPGYKYVPPFVPSQARIAHLGKTLVGYERSETIYPSYGQLMVVLEQFTDGPYEKYDVTPQVQDFHDLVSAAKVKNYQALQEAGGLTQAWF